MDTQAPKRDEAADSNVKSMRRSAVSGCCFPLEICCIQGSRGEKAVSTGVKLLYVHGEVPKYYRGRRKLSSVIFLVTDQQPREKSICGFTKQRRRV